MSSSHGVFSARSSARNISVKPAAILLSLIFIHSVFIQRYACIYFNLEIVQNPVIIMFMFSMIFGNKITLIRIEIQLILDLRLSSLSEYWQMRVIIIKVFTRAVGSGL